MLALSVIIVGLVVFEVVNSVDNVVVNAHTLQTMSERGKRWYLLWGVLTATLFTRGFMPLSIVWITTPGITFLNVLKATVGFNPLARQAIDANEYILLLGGGMFLLLLYFHWLFLEHKDPYFFHLVKPKHGIWFFAFTAIFLMAMLYLARAHPLAMLAAATGNAVFFILYGFRQMATQEERAMEKSPHSDLAKFLFLEILDTSFSIDGVLGAFAFTTNVLLIFIGNGLGALIVRELTVRGAVHIAKYRWLKNGAMTSIGLLGLFMVLKSFGTHIPTWLPTITTIGFVGLAFIESHRDLRKRDNALARA